ncbi:hypothetical protein [Moraxella lincolnii]|uniref:CTP synthetase n=1 Tax=Lwoffella lincolnii TaxID=90241 RepID=A0A1T0CGY8_9GAMM|nr:hypothetical protein [Moraxella lincolnii]OOS21539.1 hypothetical protein B0682_02295 [Moraxella lincolnii]
MNWALLSMLYSMTTTVIIGVLMIIALVVGYDEIPHIWTAVIVGAVVSAPVAYVLTKKVNQIGRNELS